MGLLSEQFEALNTAGRNETDDGEDGVDEHEEDDSRPSKTFLREALFTYRDRDFQQANIDVFSPSMSNHALVATSTPTSNTEECESKRLKVAQKGRRVGPTWKL